MTNLNISLFIILNISLFIINLFFIKMSIFLILNISLFVIGILFIIINKEFLVLPQFSPWISSWVFPTNHKDIGIIFFILGILLLMILGICDPSISHCSFDPCNVAGRVMTGTELPEKVRETAEILLKNIQPGEAETVFVLADDNSIWEIICTSKEWIEHHFLGESANQEASRFVKDNDLCRNRYDVIKYDDITSEIYEQCKHKFRDFKVSIKTFK